MAVSSPGRNAQDTRLTATWPPKRIVRSRVSSERVMDAHTNSVMPGLVPGIHVFFLHEAKAWMAGTSPAMTKKLKLPLVPDRDVHVLDLQFANRFEHRPGKVRID